MESFQGCQVMGLRFRVYGLGFRSRCLSWKLFKQSVVYNLDNVLKLDLLPGVPGTQGVGLDLGYARLSMVP